MEWVVMVRRVRLEETRERDFDLVFWQAQSSAARFDATWEYLKRQGREDELRLQRSVASLFLI